MSTDGGKEKCCDYFYVRISSYTVGTPITTYSSRSTFRKCSRLVSIFSPVTKTASSKLHPSRPRRNYGPRRGRTDFRDAVMVRVLDRNPTLFSINTSANSTADGTRPRHRLATRQLLKQRFVLVSITSKYPNEKRKSIGREEAQRWKVHSSYTKVN